MSAARLPSALAVATVVAAIAFGTTTWAAETTQSATAVDGARATALPAFASREALAKWTMGVLDGIFATEARDDEWASAREAEIRQAAAADRLRGVDSLDVACRTTVCRVVVGFDPAQARRTLLALTVMPPLNTSGFHGIDPDDERKIRLFVSKEGTVLMEHPAFVAALASRGK